jgi:hypothetical protein
MSPSIFRKSHISSNSPSPWTPNDPLNK